MPRLPPELARFADRPPCLFARAWQWLSTHAKPILFALIGLALVAVSWLQYDAIRIVDGDTVRHRLETVRLVGYDTPERGDRARCETEARLADKATQRLRELIESGRPSLKLVRCACKPGTEGTRDCNFGRSCGVLTVDGRDVGPILIAEGLAHPFRCGATSCPRRQGWC